MGERTNFLEDTTCQDWYKQKQKTWKSLLFIKEPDFVTKNLPQKETPGLDNFTGELHQTFKEEKNTDSIQTSTKNVYGCQIANEDSQHY